MDPAKKKALFRAKLNAQKKEKRINSPLVRYNEIDQPICRVCNVVLKSESLWDAHQASRKHHEEEKILNHFVGDTETSGPLSKAINNLRANAAGHPHDNTVSEPITESERHKDVCKAESYDAKYETSAKLSKPLPSATLPPDFFDRHEAKRQKTGSDTAKSVDKDAYKNLMGSAQSEAEESFLENKLNEVPNENDGMSKKIELSSNVKSIPVENTGSETKQIKGALPEGFFDNKESDLRARGIKPVKPDVKDEYKEFEKLIQEDLQEVDDRLEEEEIDAAEVIEEYESFEQKAYRQKVELLRKKKMELMAARSSKPGTSSDVAGKEPLVEESSSDDEDYENFAVDWRAQHL